MSHMDMNKTGMDMQMYFHFGHTESAVWFKFWKISTVFGEYYMVIRK